MIQTQIKETKYAYYSNFFHAAFNKLHAHGHSGIKISIKAFNQFYFIPYLQKWMSIFIHYCIECQQNKHTNRKIQYATIQTFSENASYFNYRISMDTKGPINPPAKQNSYIHVIVDAFIHFVVQYLLNKIMLKLLSTLYFTIGSPKLDLLYIWLQTVVQNTLTPNLQTFVPQWEIDCELFS